MSERRPAPAGAPIVETVFLRRHQEGWSVSLDERLLHVSRDEEAAFQAALRALREAPLGRRMMLLSGPATGRGPDALHQTPGVAAE